MATQSERSRRIDPSLLLGAGLLLVQLMVLLATLWQKPDFDDAYDFMHSGQAAGRPYTDFQFEYPPGTYLILKLLSLFATTTSDYLFATVTLAIVMYAVILTVLYHQYGSRAMLFCIACALPLTNVVFQHLDLVATLLALLSMLLLQRAQEVRGILLLVSSVFVKLWALPLALIAFPREQPRQQRYLLALIGAAVIVGIAWFSIGGFNGFTQVLGYRGAHGWQIESIPASIIRLFTHEVGHPESGAMRVQQVPHLLGTFLTTIGVLFSFATAWRARGTQQIGTAWLATVGLLLISSTLLSPQFLLWILPAAAIAYVQRDRSVAYGFALCCVLTLPFVSDYALARGASPLGLGLVALRNLLLIGTVSQATWQVWHRKTSGLSAAVQER